MGIRPTGNSSYTPPKPDDPQSRFGATIESIEESGEILGGGIAEIDAKASSANTGMSELAARVAALESELNLLEPVSSEHRGDTWRVYRRGGMITLILNGATAGFQLPDGYFPPMTTYFPMARGADDLTARVGISSSGVVGLYGAHTPPVYGTVSYPA